VEINVAITKTSQNQSEQLKTALKKSFTTLKKVIPVMVVAFLSIFFLLEFKPDVMNYISLFFDPVLRILDLPGECITALIADLAHFSAGYATVAALLTKGVITAKQAILTLLIGSMLIITVTYLKYSISTNISLFGKLGVKITVINYMSSMISKFIIILLVVIVM
jgi:hypothetical protein